MAFEASAGALGYLMFGQWHAQPFSTRAKPRAAARWLLPPPGGPNNSKLAPLLATGDLQPLNEICGAGEQRSLR
jgi:hypothetical protein